jgi:hypothetical protein
VDGAQGGRAVGDAVHPHLTGGNGAEVPVVWVCLPLNGFGMECIVGQMPVFGFGVQLVGKVGVGANDRVPGGVSGGAWTDLVLSSEHHTQHRVDDADTVDPAGLRAGDVDDLVDLVGGPWRFGDNVFGERRPGQQLQLRWEGVQVVVARGRVLTLKVGRQGEEGEQILHGHEMTHLLARNSA